MPKKLDVMKIISEPKNTMEEVATSFYLIMTCPDIKKYEHKLVLHVTDMVQKISELPKDQWKASQELATDMALTEHTPFYQDNLDWVSNYINEVINESEQQIQQLGGVH